MKTVATVVVVLFCLSLAMAQRGPDVTEQKCQANYHFVEGLAQQLSADHARAIAIVDRLS
jgi:hypothetical protein